MLAFAPALIIQQPVDKPTLELYQQRFVLRTPSELLRVPLVENKELPPAVMYRRGDAYAVWDERGLTARNAKWSFTTRMPEIVTSAKLFSRAEILENNRLVQQGTRTIDATALSGSMRVGSNAYFLLRWDASNSVPWCEVLVSVDLSLPKPKPRLVGRYTGLSASRDQIGDRLFILNSKLSVVTATDADWGLAAYDVPQESFGYKKFGDKLVQFWQTSNLAGYYVERNTGSGSAAGSIDLNKGTKRELWNAPGLASFVDTSKPELLISTGKKSQAYWSTTGAVTDIPSNTVMKRAGKYIIAWSPADKPSQATAYDPSGWKVVATWKK